MAPRVNRFCGSNHSANHQKTNGRYIILPDALSRYQVWQPGTGKVEQVKYAGAAKVLAVI